MLGLIDLRGDLPICRGWIGEGCRDCQEGKACSRGGLREFLIKNQLSDTKFIEELGQYGLCEVEKRMASYRAVLSGIKQRKRFPVHKPETHGARILQAWLAKCKRHRDTAEGGGAPLACLPLPKRARTDEAEPVDAASATQELSVARVEEEKRPPTLFDELRPCIESLQSRLICCVLS